MKNEKQTRAYEVRASESPLVIEGTAIVFNQPARMNGYTERIAPTALDGIDLSDITLLVNHDGNGIPLARTPKTLSLEVTDKGLEMRAELPDTEQGRAVYEAVKRGDLSQMSFAFDIGEQTFDAETRECTITRISAVYEISVVNRAAYPQTSVYARKEENTMMNTFNPIESAVLNTANTTDSHATAEYRSAFFKTLMGKELTEGESRAMSVAKAEKRADSFNTLSNSVAVIPTQTLNEVVSQARQTNGLFNEVRLFSVPSNLSVPVGTPADSALWHTEGASVDREKLTTTAVAFSGYELIKILSLSATVKRMELSAFESYLTTELHNCIADSIGKAIVSGTGTGQPKGILSGITWDATNSISTKELTSDNLLALIALLPAGYAGGAKFAMSTATLFGKVYPLKDADGRYLFTDAESGGVRRLFGFEIVIDDNIPVNTVVFGNYKYYGVNIPEGVAVEMSRESGFANGLIDYRALCIADGKPIVPGAFAKLEVAA